MLLQSIGRCHSIKSNYQWLYWHLLLIVCSIKVGASLFTEPRGDWRAWQLSRPSLQIRCDSPNICFTFYLFFFFRLALTLKVAREITALWIYVYYVVHISDFGMLRVNRWCGAAVCLDMRVAFVVWKLVMEFGEREKYIKFLKHVE